MLTKLGISTVLAGIFVALFSGVSQLVKADTFWVGLTLSKIIGQ